VIQVAQTAVLLIIAAVVLFFLVRWHAEISAYICPRCKNWFIISPLTDLVTPQTFTNKYLKCPKCGKRSWARVIRRHRKRLG